MLRILLFVECVLFVCGVVVQGCACGAVYMCFCCIMLRLQRVSLFCAFCAICAYGLVCLRCVCF